MAYTKHWESEKNKLETIISTHKPEMVIDELAELKTINIIHTEINPFLNYISKLKNLTFEELKEEGYKSLLYAIGFDDVSHLVSLLIITYIKDLEKKRSSLMNGLKKIYLLRMHTQ